MTDDAKVQDPSAALLTALKDERDRFVGFAFAAADVLIETDTAGIIGYAAGAVEALTGRTGAALKGTDVAELAAERDRPIVRAMVRSLARAPRLNPLPVELCHQGGGQVILGGCRLPSRAGKLQICLFRLPPSVAAAVGGAEAVDPDTLSGLPGPDAFAGLVENALKRGEGPELDLTLLELPGLKELDLAPELGRGLAASIGRYLRGASVGGVAGEVGLGKFGLVQERGANTAHVEKQIAELTAGVTPDGRPLQVSRTTVALKPSLSPQDTARAVVYAVQSFARAQPGDFTLNTLDEVVHRLAAETSERILALRATLKERAFVLHFQPIVSLADRSVHHYEALVRFDGGSPGETVAFAEQVGIVEDLDLAVVEEALAALDRVPDGPGVAINVSGRSLAGDLFRMELMRTARAQQRRAGRILFEITESAEITDLGGINRFVQDIRALGFKVCIDDFGAGAASYQYLRALQVDHLKIDGAYVKELLDSQKARAFVRSMVTLACELEMSAIAEMVETEQQAAKLAEYGVRYGQGWLFGKPAPEMAAAEGGRIAAVMPPRMNLRRKGASESWG
ncbi:MAG TPA: EAL domain-containing protein [Azospirillaceae bacterium]|nr:EAL domain-containing protein [Azospirillaceae bacterium]